jgi:hypothetical protein
MSQDLQCTSLYLCNDIIYHKLKLWLDGLEECLSNETCFMTFTITLMWLMTWLKFIYIYPQQ